MRITCSDGKPDYIVPPTQSPYSFYTNLFSSTYLAFIIYLCHLITKTEWMIEHLLKAIKCY